MSSTWASKRLKTSSVSLAHPVSLKLVWALKTVDAIDRSLSSSISGRGPKYRMYKLALHGPSSCKVTPADAAHSIEPGMRSPVTAGFGSGEVNRACDQARTRSQTSHRTGCHCVFHPIPYRRDALEGPVVPARPGTTNSDAMRRRV